MLHKGGRRWTNNTTLPEQNYASYNRNTPHGPRRSCGNQVDYVKEKLRGHRVALVVKVKIAPVGKMPEGAAARAIVDDWTAMREGSRNLTKAIMLYQSLREGDPSVLFEEFPWIASLMTPATLPASSTTGVVFPCC